VTTRYSGAARCQPSRARGSAVADFALVAALLTLLFVAVVQVAVVLHVRNTLVDCASEGARYGALADRTPEAGAQRARELITADLSARFARDVAAGRERFAGLDTVVVRVRAPLPVLGLLGGGRAITVEGHAMLESP
jgi:Flp pilus assembly protein TadG